ncbi:ADP-ribose diphosphatase [Vibrio sp. TH_r3]|uniref:ADP-ribose diphosphatase n=1 Tax=Vibrio sp. TH_r3 TaxID=3082084 RepID=UPI002955C2CF|nr:ADP-ribose diphosphatase [Vibrio sp. TH_r3]MDV7104536.1 ADP-ribose diphosphatase [Vibrio sp. TH_r3]
MKQQFKSEDLKIISKETLFKGFFRMIKYTFQYKLFEGGWSQPVERELFDRSHAAAMLPYDAVRDEVVLIEQIRVGALEHTNPWQFEIVAGIMDADEDVEELVRREAMEEAGLEVKKVESVVSYYPSAGGCSEKLDVFVGQVSTVGAGGIYGLEYENEDIKAHVVSRSKAYSMITEGQIENGASIIALQWLELNYQRLRQEWL